MYQAFSSIKANGTQNTIAIKNDLHLYTNFV